MLSHLIFTYRFLLVSPPPPPVLLQLYGLPLLPDPLVLLLHPPPLGRDDPLVVLHDPHGRRQLHFHRLDTLRQVPNALLHHLDDLAGGLVGVGGGQEAEQEEEEGEEDGQPHPEVIGGDRGGGPGQAS